MNIKDFIEKAIEGGYDRYALSKGFELKSYATVLMPNNFFIQLHDGSDIHIAAFLLDPLAWEAVGKVEGWDVESKQFEEPKDISGDTRTYLISGWLYKWHAMLDALAEGKTIEEFLKTL